jgi:hypothetical protein
MYFKFIVRHNKLTVLALADLDTRKEKEKLAAVEAQRKAMQGAVDAAHKERDEHKENYSKVTMPPLHCIVTWKYNLCHCESILSFFFK